MYLHISPANVEIELCVEKAGHHGESRGYCECPYVHVLPQIQIDPTISGTLLHGAPLEMRSALTIVPITTGENRLHWFPYRQERPESLAAN